VHQEDNSLLITRDRVTGSDIVSVNIRDPKNQMLVSLLQQQESFDKRGVKRKIQERTTTLSDTGL
jgi:hypothetical protein